MYCCSQTVLLLVLLCNHYCVNSALCTDTEPSASMMLTFRLMSGVDVTGVNEQGKIYDFRH